MRRLYLTASLLGAVGVGWLGCATPIEIPAADGAAFDSRPPQQADSGVNVDSPPTAVPDLGDNGGLRDIGYSGDGTTAGGDGDAAGDATMPGDAASDAAGDATMPGDAAGDGDIVLDDAMLDDGSTEDALPGDAVAVDDDAGGDDA